MLKTMLLTVAVLVACSAAKPEFADDPNAYPVPPLENGGFIVPAQVWLMHAPNHYRAIYGNWPSSWEAVEESGLVQIPLYSLDGTLVSDEELTGPYDEKYEFPAGRSVPCLVNANGPYLDFAESGSPLTWDELFSLSIERSSYPAAQKETIEQMIGDRDRQRLMGIVSILQESLRYYFQVHRTVPQSWAEFIDSGMAPLNADSVNPLTGGPIYGDGRPNDINFFINAEGTAAGV
jgi:hypothetical protein